MVDPPSGGGVGILSYVAVYKLKLLAGHIYNQNFSCGGGGGGGREGGHLALINLLPLERNTPLPTTTKKEKNSSTCSPLETFPLILRFATWQSSFVVYIGNNQGKANKAQCASPHVRLYNA